MLGHIKSLDGLRAVAVLMVLAIHLWRFPEGHDVINAIAGAGWIGVDLFFVLSGFLITRILFATKTGPGYFRNFYARRSLRIFPVYYAFLIVVFIGLPLVAMSPELESVQGDAVWYALYASNFVIGLEGWKFAVTNVTWSLAIEEQFYLLWPAVVRWLTKRRLIALCIALIVVCPIARLVTYEFTGGWIWPYVTMPLRADAFAWGGLVALLGPEFFRRHAATTLAAGGACILAAVTAGEFLRWSPFVSSIGYSATGMVSAAALVLALSGRLPILTSKPLLAIGKVSYGMYLLQFICLSVLNRIYTGEGGLLQSAVFFIASATLTYVVAALSFRLFEAPILRLKRYFEVPPAVEASPQLGPLAPPGERA